MRVPRALGLLTVALAAACGTASPPSSAPSSAPIPTTAGRESGPAPRGCDTPGKAITVTAADDGGVVCLVAGGVLTVSLSGDGWHTDKGTGDVLRDSPSGHYLAVRPGKTTLSLIRANCPTGTPRCHSLQAFSVRVAVS